MAFLIVVDGFDDMVACADSSPKAKYVTYKSAQDAGYYSVTFQRIRSKRAPEFDEWAAKQDQPRVVSRQYAR